VDDIDSMINSYNLIVCSGYCFCVPIFKIVTGKNDLTRHISHREAVFGTVIHGIFDAWHYKCAMDLHVD